MQATVYKINKNVLLYSTRNYIQYLAINYNRKKIFKKNRWIRENFIILYSIFLTGKNTEDFNQCKTK